MLSWTYLFQADSAPSLGRNARGNWFKLLSDASVELVVLAGFMQSAQSAYAAGVSKTDHPTSRPCPEISRTRSLGAGAPGWETVTGCTRSLR